MVYNYEKHIASRRKTFAHVKLASLAAVLVSLVLVPSHNKSLCGGSKASGTKTAAKEATFSLPCFNAFLTSRLKLPCDRLFASIYPRRREAKSSGPVHTNPETFVSGNFSFRRRLSSTLTQRIREVYPETFESALQSGNF